MRIDSGRDVCIGVAEALRHCRQGYTSREKVAGERMQRCIADSCLFHPAANRLRHKVRREIFSSTALFATSRAVDASRRSAQIKSALSVCNDFGNCPVAAFPLRPTTNMDAKLGQFFGSRSTDTTRSYPNESC